VAAQTRDQNTSEKVAFLLSQFAADTVPFFQRTPSKAFPFGKESFSAFPSRDGPSHVYNAFILNHTGDTVAIPGNYQHAAIHSGPAAPKFWHTERSTASLETLQLRSGTKLPDVGCGSGVFASMAARQGAFVVGVDANKDAAA
jgi:hypothetical protein